MNKFSSIDELFDFAINEEHMAAEFYRKLADQQKNDWMKKVFEDFAKEELGHKAKLIGLKDGKYFRASDEKVMDLKIADYVVDVPTTSNMDYQQALVLAMKKEKAAFRMYMDMAEQVQDDDIKQSLIGMAQEEAKHKLRFEIEYDNDVLTDN